MEALAAVLDAKPRSMYTWNQMPTMGYDIARPIHFACYAGSLEAAQLLLDRGADPDTVSKHTRTTPLGYACRYRRAAVVALLLERGADPNFNPWYNRTTMLMRASSTYRHVGGPDRQVAVIRLLLEDGRVPVNAQDEEGCTALWHACESGYAERSHVERVRVLLMEGGADHTIADYKGRRPVDVARDPAIVQLFQVCRVRAG